MNQCSDGVRFAFDSDDFETKVWIEDSRFVKNTAKSISYREEKPGKLNRKSSLVFNKLEFNLNTAACLDFTDCTVNTLLFSNLTFDRAEATSYITRFKNCSNITMYECKYLNLDTCGILLEDSFGLIRNISFVDVLTGITLKNSKRGAIRLKSIRSEGNKYHAVDIEMPCFEDLRLYDVMVKRASVGVILNENREKSSKQVKIEKVQMIDVIYLGLGIHNTFSNITLTRLSINSLSKNTVVVSREDLRERITIEEAPDNQVITVASIPSMKQIENKIKKKKDPLDDSSSEDRDCTLI